MQFHRKCLSSYKWVEMNSCTCVHTDWPRHLIKDTWSCLTDHNRYLKCAHTRKRIHMSLWCVLPLMCWSALQRVAFLGDYSLTHDPPHGLPVWLVTAGRLSSRYFSSTIPRAQCTLASRHRLPNKQTRGSNFMPTSLSGAPVTGFVLFIYSQFHKAPLGMFVAKVLDSETACKEVVIVLLAFCITYQFIHGYDIKSIGTKKKNRYIGLHQN